ncbi:MAG: hypothetical protein KBD52_02500 [Candidatus Pacebacteria bacterium]|nr:hypothetical protein [Candidatus Paceibacterota bacterium]
MDKFLILIAVILEVFAYSLYFRDTIKNKIKPHPMSWFVWFLLGGVGFFIQVKAGAGLASIVTAISSLACLIILSYGVIKSFKQGLSYIKYSKSEWISFIFALLIFIFYLTTKNGLVSIILVALVDTLGFVPTFIKTWRNPHEEQIFLYIISLTKYTLVLLTLVVFSMETAFYPAVLVFTNLSFVLFAFFRRKYFIVA